MPSDANAPNSSTAVAPTLAPEETPRRNGSARALRTSTCTTVPAVVSAAPTTAASSTRGRRICQTISSATVFFGWPARWSTMTCHTAPGLRETDPMPTPRVMVTTRSTAQRRARSTNNGGREVGSEPCNGLVRTALPPRATSSMQHRRPGSPPKGTTVAGQRRILTGLRCNCTAPVIDRARSPYAQGSGRRQM
jgi:hypothetical protein